jgi:hypothetical protein
MLLIDKRDVKVQYCSRYNSSLRWGLSNPLLLLVFSLAWHKVRAVHPVVR